MPSPFPLHLFELIKEQLNYFKILGSISLNVERPEFKAVCIKINNGIERMPGYCDRDRKGNPGAVLQVHPNLDKAAWQSESLLSLKSEQKPYPVGTDVSILKWTVHLSDEESLPLACKIFLSSSIKL